MKLNVSFDSLWVQVRRLTNKVDDFKMDTSIREVDPIDIQLGEGLEVSIDDLNDTGGLFEYKGRQVLLYIPDHARKVSEVIAGNRDGKKFHLCDCRTLVDMRSKNRFNRYFATTDLSGVFKVSGQSMDGKNQVDGVASLKVCMNCIDKLNYKDSGTARNVKYAVRDSFVIQEFFETYSSCFPYLPKVKTDPTAELSYTKDWPDISARKRSNVNYVCEECHVDLIQYKNLLHVHHTDGQKGNNSPNNLKALCVDCHRAQPMHSSMFVKHQDMKMITKLRNANNVIKSGWDEALQYADPAIKGALGLLKSKGWAAPVIGYEIMGDNGQVIVELEAAWPDTNKGVYIRDVNKNVLTSWKLYSLGDVINNIDVIR